jgi:hypothetical protein
MNMIDEIKETFKMEIRPNSQGSDYLEAVLDTKDMPLLNSLLKRYLGPAVKEQGKEVNLPKEIEELVDSLGGVRKGQSFFYSQEGHYMMYAALWPWESNPTKVTLKAGVSELNRAK